MEVEDLYFEKEEAHYCIPPLFTLENFLSEKRPRACYLGIAYTYSGGMCLGAKTKIRVVVSLGNVRVVHSAHN